MSEKIKKLFKRFKRKFSQEEIIFFIFEGLFLAIFCYLLINTENSIRELGNYFHNVNIALLTMLIPLAIAVLSDYFRAKRNNDNIDYAELDLVVIINSVFDVKPILLTLLFVYLPSFFWSGSNFFVKNLLLVIWLIGVGILVKIILDFIIWIKNPYHHRFKFLKRIKQDEEYLLAWTSVWKAKEKNRNNELEFFEIFSKNVNYLIDNKNTTFLLNGLLGNFARNIENREKDILLYWGKKSPFEKILEWYYKAETYGQNEKGFPFDYEIYPVLEYVEIQSLDKSYHRYFELLKKHLEKHSDDIRYIENFFDSFLSILFSNLDKISSEISFWKTFPDEWKIKSINLEKKTIIPQVAFLRTIEWAENRIYDALANENYDSQMNKVFYNLFSDTEPISWANIFTFLFFPYSENKIKEIIESRRVFGTFGRMTVAWGEDSVVSEKAKNKYIAGIEENKKLLKFIYAIGPSVFPDYGTIRDYQGILRSFEGEYANDRNKLNRIREFLFVLSVLEEFINAINKK